MPPAIAAALADPIVRALMAAGGVDEDALKRLLLTLVAARAALSARRRARLCARHE